MRGGGVGGITLLIRLHTTEASPQIPSPPKQNKTKQKTKNKQTNKQKRNKQQQRKKENKLNGYQVQIGNQFTSNSESAVGIPKSISNIAGVVSNDVFNDIIYYECVLVS